MFTSILNADPCAEGTSPCGDKSRSLPWVSVAEKSAKSENFLNADISASSSACCKRDASFSGWWVSFCSVSNSLRTLSLGELRED